MRSLHEEVSGGIVYVYFWLGDGGGHSLPEVVAEVEEEEE